MDDNHPAKNESLISEDSPQLYTSGAPLLRSEAAETDMFSPKCHRGTKIDIPVLFPGLKNSRKPLHIPSLLVPYFCFR